MATGNATLHQDEVLYCESLVINGNTLSGTELGFVDGVTAGTGLASKALVLDANGTVLLPAPLRYDVNTAITAFASGGQASATALTGEYNDVTICATAGDSVKLPSAVGGESVVVKNSGATSLAVFPAASDSINALAVNLSVNIPVGGTLRFFAKSATVWETQEAIVLPAPTTQRGELVIKAADNAADHEVVVVNASHGQATTHTIPDPGGAAASFVLTEGTQTINGTKTIAALVTTNLDAGASGTAGTVDVFPATATRGKFVLSCENQDADTAVTLKPAAMGQAAVVSIPDPGASTANVLLTSAANDGVVVASTAAQLDAAVAGTPLVYRTQHLAAAVETGGAVVVPAVAGQQFQVLNLCMRAYGGNAANATTIEITEETAGTVFLSHVVADMTAGTWVGQIGGTAVITGMTNGGMTSAANKGLHLSATGGAGLDTCTGVDVVVCGYYTTT